MKWLLLFLVKQIIWLDALSPLLELKLGPAYGTIEPIKHSRAFSLKQRFPRIRNIPPKVKTGHADGRRPGMSIAVLASQRDDLTAGK
ncbi:hypothetical protein BKA61DRAFT_612153 [Leptodontidium sp. MPI-SDFR-AT-0119]|nr:hypothetical protein BKA61DRAFT_612153 [Leptodontidium sp. MPI-SDFR-AT-0119]